MPFRTLIILALVFAALIAPSAVAATTASTKHSSSFEVIQPTGQYSGDIVPGEILVKVKRPFSPRALTLSNKRMQAQETGYSSTLGVQRLKLPDSVSIDRALAEYRKLPYVEYAEPNYIRRAFFTPNDPYFSLQWALPRIGAPDFWDKAGTANVLIAVIDTGVDYTHPELSPVVIKGYDFINRDSDPMDDHFHGTHVAGIIAAKVNNGVGIAGIAPDAKILAVKVLSHKGEGTDLQIADGITYAADKGAKIINLSLGGPGWSSILESAIEYAISKGCIVVASAGNDATDEAYYPAGYDGVISVSATDSYNRRASFSNYGASVDIAAPGVDILSTYSDGAPGYVYASGTSMAAPVVCGAAALIAATYPDYSVDQLYRTVLLSTTDLGPSGRDGDFGYGMVDLAKVTAQRKTTVEENADGITTAGSWQSRAIDTASGGSYVSSTSAGSSLTYTFNGSSICWFAKTGSYSGIARVSLDGVLQQKVDLYSESSSFKQPVFYKGGLAAGQHTLTIEVTAEKNSRSFSNEVNIDGFDVGDMGAGVVSRTAPPTGLTADTKAHAVVLSWDASTGDGVTGYNIYRSVSASTGFIKLNRSPVMSTTYTNFGVKSNVTYHYKVTAVNRSGDESAATSPVSIREARTVRSKADAKLNTRYRR